MAKAEQTCKSGMEGLNIDFMRSLVKQYSELGQWTSALFWADAAAGAGSVNGEPSGDDVWLLASTMLGCGELHRAALTVTSRGLHKQHLLCLGVAMRAHVQAREPAAALALYDDCAPALLEPRAHDRTHNRALCGVLVCRARALRGVERREAAGAALAAALAADPASMEALDLLLTHHALTYAQESELISSLPLSAMLGPGEALLARRAYRARLLRHSPALAADVPEHDIDPDCPLSQQVEAARGRTLEGRSASARRLAAAGEWKAALNALGPGVCAPDLRAACLLELRKSAELFAFAHTLVDSYPHTWQAWYAVGCYYYLIGKSEFARRYLSKAKSIEPGAGCVWLAYGHSFARDSEHDPAMAAYFKASQLMPGCHLPPLYVGVESALLNNFAMSERFLARAAALHRYPQDVESSPTQPDENKSGWERLAAVTRCPVVAHEAAAAALAASQPAAAAMLANAALTYAAPSVHEVTERWAPTLDLLGHAYRKLGQPEEALKWHQRALALRPGRSATYCAMGLCLSLLGREPEAADVLHAALAKDPDDVVALALLDAIVDRLDAALTLEEIPQFPFPPIRLSLPSPAAAAADATNNSDMSMSFD